MASKKELRALITLAGKIDPSLQSTMLKATGESMKLSQNLKQSAEGLNRVGTIAKGAFLGSLASKAFTTFVSEVKNLATSGIKLASDLKEVQNVVDTTFTENSKVIDEWAKQAKDNFGLTTLQAKQYSGTLGAMLKSTGLAGDTMVLMSQNLAGLAGDFASFYNLDHDEAFSKIRAGIAGETEPLKQLGINMSVANLEAFALSKGIKTSWKDMDQASQTLLRYNYLMSTSADAQGDFAKTTDEYANQQRLWDTNLKEFSATIANKALPYLNEFYKKANKFITDLDIDKAVAIASGAFENLANMINWTRENSDWLIPVIGGVATAFAGLLIINTINDGLKAYRLAMLSTEAVTAISKGSILGLNAAMLVQKATMLHATYVAGGFNAVLAANPIGIAVIAIGALVAGSIALWKNWDKVKAKAAELGAAAKKYIEPVAKFFGLGKESNGLKAASSTIGFSASTMLEGYAEGGIAKKPAIFGEAGPEMAIPLKRTQRSLGLLNQTAQILGADSNPQGASIQFYYNPTIYGGSRAEIEPILRQHKEEIKEMIRDILEDDRRVQLA